MSGEEQILGFSYFAPQADKAGLSVDPAKGPFNFGFGVFREGGCF
ncbi:MAG: hypothetical protein AB1523_16155 [Bacillota bacterium]